MMDSSIARSIKSRLLNMADGDNKRYQQLMVRFFHERVLYRLSNSIYRERFILKGGTLLYAFTEFMPRPTLDMDFMGTRIDNDKENILESFSEVFSVEAPEDGVTFMLETLTAEDITVDKQYPGVRLSILASLGTYLQKLTLDIGFGDIVVPSPMRIEYPSLFKTMTDPDILAYSLETVVAEKFQTMIDRGRFNSRMKDYFDLYRIFTGNALNDTILREAIEKVFVNRMTPYVENHEFFGCDFGQDILLEQQWRNYVRKLKVTLPSFKEVHHCLVEYLRPYWDTLNKS